MLSIDWGQTANVVFSGLFIVFLALVLLIMLVYLMGRALKTQTKQNDISQPIPAAPAAPNPPAPVVQAAAPSQGETIAVISAAVASYMDDSAPGTAYAVTSVAPAGSKPGREKGTRPVWGFAGMRQNTEPF